MERFIQFLFIATFFLLSQKSIAQKKSSILSKWVITCADKNGNQGRFQWELGGKTLNCIKSKHSIQFNGSGTSFPTYFSDIYLRLKSYIKAKHDVLEFQVDQFVYTEYEALVVCQVSYYIPDQELSNTALIKITKRVVKD